MGVDQGLDLAFRLPYRHVQEGRHRPGGEIGRVEQPGQPEGPLRARGKRTVAHLESRADVEVARHEFVQPVPFLPEDAGEVGQAPLPSAEEPGRRDADRQRDPAAQPGDLQSRVRVVLDAFVADDPSQHAQGLGRRQDVELQQARALETDQPDTSGEEHGRAGSSGQERPHLLLPGDVVEQDEDSASGQAAPVERHAFFQGFGDCRWS